MSHTATNRKSIWAAVVSAGLTLLVGACSPATPSDSQQLVGVDETVNSNTEGVTGSLPVGSQLRTTANLNFRTGPSTGYKVLRVLAMGTTVEVVQSASSNQFYQVKHNGTVGWAHGGFMTVVSTPTGGTAGVSGPLTVGTYLETVADLNLRTGPSTSYQVLTVMSGGSSVKTVEKDPSNSFYKVDFLGTVGWAHGGYMRTGTSPNDPPAPSSANVQGAIDRAKAGVGFSYWWGHARWLPGGPTASTKGSCSGSCPSCSHSGSYGADCSGYVGKIWQVPSNNNDLTYDWHPYSTATFVGSSSLWSTVSRSSLKKADALVYNSGGAGHIVLYESGDGWGSMWAYECKGCSAGCVRNLRTASSAYKGIRRSGY